MSTKKNNELLIDESFVVRPKGKPDEAVRGRLLKWRDSDYVAFEPQKKKGQLCAFLTIDSNLPKEQMSGRLFRLSSEINKIIDNNKFKS